MEKIALETVSETLLKVDKAYRKAAEQFANCAIGSENWKQERKRECSR